MNKQIISNYKQEVGQSLELLLDTISEHKIVARDFKNSNIEDIKVPNIREIKRQMGLKTPIKEVLQAQNVLVGEKVKTSEKIDEINKKIMFLLNNFEEELSELLEELSDEM